MAESLQEAADQLSSGEMRTKMSQAVDAAHSGSGSYADYLDHKGDEQSGTVRYMSSDSKSGSAMKMAPYTKGTATSDSDYSVDTSKAKKVAPVTTYVEQPDDCDGYAAMEAAKLYTKGPVPLFERFVSKVERDAASASDFAGKGKSFPILKKEDVAAAASSLGRAGSDNHSVATIKANIIKIAKAKGWESELPASWTSATEAAPGPATESIRFVESTVSFPDLPETIRFPEGAQAYPLVKMIDAGRGSSGYYTAEVLKRDGPKIYKAGTPMYINHATAAEAASRPERDWNSLAAVTTGDAYWDENGRDGPALYAPADVFSRFAPEIREKAKHTGVSICASGVRDDKAIAPDGKPGLITALTNGDSVDFVTRAGRGGKLLIESALEEQGGPMPATELQKLQEATRNINLRLASEPARRLASETLRTIRIPEAAKVAITERALTGVAITEAGAFDEATFKKTLEAEIQFAASFIPGGAQVVGLGTAVVADPKVQEANDKREREERKFSLDRSARQFGLKTEEGRRIFREGRSGFDPTFNSLTDAKEGAALQEV